jgi:hypothetical protein
MVSPGILRHKKSYPLSSIRKLFLLRVAVGDLKRCIGHHESKENKIQNRNPKSGMLFFNLTIINTLDPASNGAA